MINIKPEEKIEFLKDSRNYPEKPAKVDIIETHMSWIFLTSEKVLKLKKPVKYDYLDFSTLEKRKIFCEQELYLNRRLAGNVYEDVIPLSANSDGKLHFGNESDVKDWMVKMKRLPDKLIMDYQIKSNVLDLERVKKAAELLGVFYQNSIPCICDPQEYTKRLLKGIEDNQMELKGNDYLDSEKVYRITDIQKKFLNINGKLFAERVLNNKIIEGHGDLRPEHVCLFNQPVFFDCLEFNHEFRIIDAIDEIAFLAMECEHYGDDRVGDVFFDVYRSITCDEFPEKLVVYYKSHKACLRARLSIQHIKEDKRDIDKWVKKAEDYLRIAEKLVQHLN